VTAIAEPPTLDPKLPMSELLAVYPGAQRALFRRYHVGGCSSCGFAPAETLTQICARNPHMDLEEVCAYLQTSREEDRAMQIEPAELRDLMAAAETQPVHLLDIRTREEYEAVHIPGARLFSQELMNTILMQWPRTEGLIVLIDHQGARSLDAAAYFSGHGFTNVKALLGGIDAWSQQIDPSLPRYQLEQAA
jgi:rhodanese-related sulfurtransferase